jgi:4-aminobutyrate aminotransferase/(S)-3-amino-2-methylpropionate transaminase
LEESALNLVDPSKVAAVILEPIQGEGGFNPVPKKYLEGLRAYCTKHGIMLILDEIQSGFCRTGNWASWQNYGVTPDLSTYAKSMGSGLPIAAVVGRADVMDAAAGGSIGGTYIGSPIACVASLATIQYMKDINLNQKGKDVGQTIMNRMTALKDKYSEIGDVRGVGAMIGIEFVKDEDPKQPDTEICSKIVANCAENGLIVISAGIFKNVIRILSPLVISPAELDKGLSILEQAIIKSISN